LHVSVFMFILAEHLNYKDMTEIRKQLQVDIKVDTHTLLWQLFNERKHEAKQNGETFYMSDMVEEIILNYINDCVTDGN